MPEHAREARSARTAPVYPRRVSGPSRRAVPAGPAVPHRGRGRTSAFEKLSRLPDHRVVDRLLRGRACIWVIGLMLGGIVAMQVSLLRLNSGISRAVRTASTLERQNMALQAGMAELTSGERVATAATALGMIDPPAGETRYLTARVDKDASRAVKRMRPPNERAKAIMANGGMLPGALAAPGTAAAALAASLNGQPAPATTTTPVPATTSAAPVPTATPAAVTTPVPTTTPIPTAAPVTTPVPTATPIPTAAPVTTAPGTGAATTG